MKFKIMTYNICSGKDFSVDANITHDGDSSYNISACANTIRDISPDVCGINEINEFLPSFQAEKTNGGTPADQAAYLSETTGLPYHAFGEAIFFEGRGGYGNALISKHEITSSAVHKIPDPEVKDEFGYYESRAILETKIDIAGGITVLQLHAGLNTAEKQNAVTKLLELIEKIDTPLIIMGDLNMRPSDWILDRLREKLQDITPMGEGYIHTFPSWSKSDECASRYDLNPTKIDYIFASHHFKKCSCEVIRSRASDHMPMLAVLEI